jgi:hypothetical protein
LQENAIDPVLNQMNLTLTFTAYRFEIHFNISIPSTPRFHISPYSSYFILGQGIYISTPFSKIALFFSSIRVKDKVLIPM